MFWASKLLFLSTLESLRQLKEAPHGTVTTFSVIATSSAIGLIKQASNRGFFSKLTTLKNANLCIFGHKITGLAYFKPIRYLVYVPHGSSIAALVFIMTLAAGPRGAGSSNFFPKLAILQTANWHVLSLKITVFPYFELLRLQKEAIYGIFFSVVCMTSTFGL